jgi:hypothetical protein
MSFLGGILRMFSTVTTEWLDTHEAHERFLRRAFQEAHERLFIVSPVICVPAIETFSDAFRRATAQLTVITSAKVSEEAGDLLGSLGCIVQKKHIGYNTVAVDDKYIVIGSYHWLGVTKADERRDKSVVCKGPEARQRIREEWAWHGRHPGSFALENRPAYCEGPGFTATIAQTSPDWLPCT